MAKKGLKNFNQFLTTNFTLGESHFNLNSSNDFYLNIPIISKDNISPIDISLIYTNDDIVLPINFGRGVKPSFYLNIAKTNNRFTLIYADGFSLDYTYDEETQTYVNNYDKSFIKIKYNNSDNKICLYLESNERYVFDINGNNNIIASWVYPSKIIDSYDNEITFTKTDTCLTIDCYKGYVIELYINMDGFVAKIDIKNRTYDYMVRRFSFNYSNGNLITIARYLTNETYIDKCDITYSSNNIIKITSSPYNDEIDFVYTNNKITEITDNKNKSNILINKEAKETTLTNERNEVGRYYFDYDDFPYAYKDYKNYFKYYDYDSKGHLIRQTKPMLIDDHATNKINLINKGDFESILIAPWQNYNLINNTTRIPVADNDIPTDFATKYLKITEDNNTSFHGIYQDIDISGYAGDTFTLFFLFKYVLVPNIQTVLEVFDGENIIETITNGTMSSLTSTYCPYVKTFKVNYKYTSLRLKILSKCTTLSMGSVTIISKLDITAVQFIKGSLEINNTYDGNKLIKTNNGKEIDLYYYPQSLNSPSSLAAISSSTFSTSFDKKDENGNFNEITVNNKYTTINRKDEFGNVIETKTCFRNKYIKHNYEYDENETLLIKEIDENAVSKEYTYDGDYFIKSISMFGNKIEYSYFTNKLLSSLTYSNSNVSIIKNDFTYDNLYRLKDIVSNKINVDNTLTLLDKYNYAYNDNDLLSDVTYSNDSSLESYDYENISSSFPRYMSIKNYGENNYFCFEYSSDGLNLLNVKFLQAIKYTFEYDELDRLVSATNIDLSLSITYTYDELNNLKTISDRNTLTTYYYDNEHNQYALRHKLNTTNNYVYSLNSKYDLSNDFDTIIHELEKIEGVYVLTMSRYIDDPSTTEVEANVATDIYNYCNNEVSIIYSEQNNPTFDTSAYAFNSFIIKPITQGLATNAFCCNFKHIEDFGKCSVGFFYKNLIVCDKQLFSLSFGDGYRKIVFGVNESNKFYYEIHTDDSGLYYHKNTTNVVASSDLEHVKINISFSPLTIEITTNNHNFVYQYGFTFSSSLFEWKFENKANVSIDDGTLGLIAFPYITLSNEFISTENREKIENIVNILKTIPNDNAYTKSAITLIPYSSVLSSYVTYPLDGSFNSLSDNGLFYKDIQKDIPPFVYNDEAKQNVFRPLKNNKVFIDPSLSNKGTIIINFYYSINTQGTLFELSPDRNNTFIKAYIENGKLMLERNTSLSNIVETNANVYEGWNTLLLSYQYKEASGTLLSRVELSLMLNNNENQYNFIRAVTIPKQYLSIGNSFNEDNHYTGLLSNLMFKATYLVASSTNHTSIINALKQRLSFVNTKDELDRPISDTIYFGDNEVLTKNYGYNNIGVNSSRVGTLINSVDISTQSKTYNSSYSLQEGTNLISEFNLTGYENNALNRYQYVYDNRNRLQTVGTLGTINDQILYTYTYDDNGNILTINGNDNTFEYYDGNRIKRYNNKHFSYREDDNMLIDYISIKDDNGDLLDQIELDYIGHRLTGYQGEGNTITFAYDHTGKRIRKVVNGVTKDYYYEGNKLIATKINNNYVYYFYDNNSVAGFIYNNNYYFYIKDVLGTIREVIDKDGVVKCSYNYTPFGKVINSSGDDTLLEINDILFKGYVYDKETGLYWVSSRYYSPELCRFISPDSVDYLDPSSISGLNLYAYANNNPIMYYDPSGHSAILIGLIIGALIGFGTAAYIDYQDDGQIFNGSVAWYDYLGATVLGGAIGAGLGAFAGMSFSASIPTFGWINSGGSLMFGVTGSIAVTVTGAEVLGIAGLLGGICMFAKTSRQPGKVTSSDKPSWVNESMVDPNKSAQQNAKDILDWKYGPGNWPKGPGTEYNKIVKWIERYLRYYRGW